MKPSWGIILSSLYCAASAASKSTAGHVYMHDSSIKSKDTLEHSVTLETARLILAQRLGLSRYHALKDADEWIVEQLNNYGGPAQRLFGGDRESNQAHALIWLDGVEDPETIITQSASSEYSQFNIISTPPSSSNGRLLADFSTQAKALPKRSDPNSISFDSDEILINILKSTISHREVLVQHNHVTIVHDNVSNNPKTQSSYSHAIAALLQAAQKSHFSLTIVLTPSTNSKPNKKYPYGTYTLPTHRLAPRKQVPEAILSSGAPSASAAATNNSDNTPNLTPLASTGPLLGILPACYASQSACEAATRNCTGHGACAKTRRGEQRAGGKGKYNDCFSCVCLPTVVKNAKGQNKTTNWGGPGCQKKDVVVEFWLFAGATVGLMFLVGSGIGMLYSMGEEQLPSVIGAGVSGPQRK